MPTSQVVWRASITFHNIEYLPMRPEKPSQKPTRKRLQNPPDDFPKGAIQQSLF
jgi:hypothetical protein